MCQTDIKSWKQNEQQKQAQETHLTQQGLKKLQLCGNKQSISSYPPQTFVNANLLCGHMCVLIGLVGEKTADEASSQPSVIRHVVTSKDTLVGLSIKYGIRVDDIKRLNNLTSNSIFEHKYLLIPNPKR